MVNIEVKNGIQYNKDYSAFITFKYSPKYVELMRSQPVRYWHSDIKAWEVPYANIDLVINKLSETEYSIKMDKSISEAIENKGNIGIPEDYVFKTKPFSYQVDGIEYGLNHKKFLMGDEQGLGKSKQMLDLACINKQLYGYKHCLIIACVNGLKYNWQNEVNIHTNESGYILGTRVNRKGIETIGSNKDRLDDLKNIDNIKSYFIITNIETLRYSETVQVPCKTKSPSGKTKYKKVTKFPIVEELQKLCRSGEISMIVVDEIHRCFSGDTLILTSDGLLPIKQVVADKSYNVATMNDNNEVEFVKPANYFINPKQLTMMQLQIETSTGMKTVTCTSSHKFLTKNRGYVCAKDLTEFDDIVEVIF